MAEIAGHGWDGDGDDVSTLFAQRHVLACFLMDYIPEEDSSAGLELTVLRRAEIFAQYLKVQPWLVTHTYQPRLVEGALRQQRLGRLTCAKIANLYDFIQDIARGVTPPQHHEIELPEGAQIRKSSAGGGFFVTNKAGEDILYVHYPDPALIGRGIPDCINHIRDGSIVSRTVYDPLGFISREEEVNPATGMALSARFFRPDGTLALLETYPEKLDTAGSISSAVVYNRKGQEIYKCEYKDELVYWWLNALLSDQDTFYLLSCDHALFYQRYFIELARQPAAHRNCAVIESTHNAHIMDANEPLTSTLGHNYLFLGSDQIRTDMVVTQTEWQLRDIAARFKEQLYELDFIPNPLTELRHLPGYIRPARSARDLAIVGRLVKEKGHDHALRCLQILRRSVHDAKLHIFGNGERAQEINSLARELGLSEAVILHGFRADMRTAFESCTAVLCCSHHEGYSRVIQEALSCGCPVISFDVPYGPREMIEDGVNGYLIPYADCAAMAERAAALMKDSRLRRTLSKNALHSVEKFKPEAIARRWSAVITRTLDNAAKLTAVFESRQKDAAGTSAAAPGAGTDSSPKSTPGKRASKTPTDKAKGTKTATPKAGDKKTGKKAAAKKRPAAAKKDTAKKAKELS